MKELFDRGYGLLRAAPIVIFTVAIVLLYNEYSNRFFIWFTGAKPSFSVGGFFVELPDFLRRLPILLSLTLFVLGTLGACAISIYSTTSFTLAFRGRPNSLLKTLQKTRLKNIWFLFLCHVVVVPFTVLWLTLCYLALSATSLPLSFKSYSFLLISALTFILYYMTLAVAVIIAIVDDTVSNKLRKFKYFATLRSFSRLSQFYLIRIGAELGIIALTGIVLSWLRVRSEYILPIIVVALTVLPFALLRSSGFVLKLEILRPDNYFRTLFENYYSGVQT